MNILPIKIAALLPSIAPIHSQSTTLYARYFVPKFELILLLLLWSILPVQFLIVLSLRCWRFAGKAML